jgi:hypothetical protein
MPIEIKNQYGQGVLSGDYSQSLDWKYTKNWLGNKLSGGKAVIFPKFKNEEILKVFNDLL